MHNRGVWKTAENSIRGRTQATNILNNLTKIQPFFEMSHIKRIQACIFDIVCVFNVDPLIHINVENEK